MNIDRSPTDENPPVETSENQSHVSNDRPFRLMFGDQNVFKEPTRKTGYMPSKNNKENISSPNLAKIEQKSERPSNIFSHNFTRPKLEMLSLQELHPEDNNGLPTDKSQVMIDNPPFQPKSILKLPKFSMRNEVEHDTYPLKNPQSNLQIEDNLPLKNATVGHNLVIEDKKNLQKCSLIIQDEPEREVKETKSPLKRDRVNFNLPSIEVMQENPSAVVLGRESLKMADSIVMDTQYLQSHHAFMKSISRLHLVQLFLILVVAIICYCVPVYREFLRSFPYFVTITGASALLILVLLIFIRKLGSKKPFNVILYFLYCLLLAVSVSIIGIVDKVNIGLLYASGMMLAVSLFLGSYAALKSTPVTFTGGMWVGLFSVFLVFGYSLILMESKNHPIVYWVSLAGVGYGLYMAYNLRQLSSGKRTIWGVEDYVAATLCLHFDWILIVWEMSKFVAVTYNNSRMSLRLSRPSVNIN
jgi:FtsH-binding integral membrane protein